MTLDSLNSRPKPSGYGIVLLEMFIGKMSTDEMFDDNLNLHNYVRMVSPERVADVADSGLIRHDDECLISIFGIGLACSEETPSERLNTKEIVTKLLVIKKELIRTEGKH
ncbi:unnamed protein product [Ilex paraguariensis]|uniref:Uncharacterized protein n=1 Tax=Ilex paraguariensis TaxID=185542 RepID=A0ABC8RWQ8_9AQUA